MIRFVAAVLAAAAATACGTSSERLSDDEQTPAVAQATIAQTEQCPPDWPGPWTACDEAGWVRQIAERAGYRVVGDTGSALLAQGGGQGFYIWATDEIQGSRATPVLGTVAGVRVYGEKSLHRSWAAQGFVFWLEGGPFSDSRLPDLADMYSLVRASLELPAPA